MKGYVYILVNKHMPDFVKIGRTSRDVDVRAREIWQTGVPDPFDVYCSEKTPDCVQLEAFLHAEFHSKRVNKSREFFAVGPEHARARLLFWTKIQAQEMINDNFDSPLVVEEFKGGSSE